MKQLTIFLLLSFGVNAQSLDAYYNTGEYAKAIDAFRIIEDPSVEDQIVLAKAYCAKGMNSKCVETYQVALEHTDPNAFIVAKFNYAKLLQTQNAFKASDSIYQQLLLELPDNAEFYYQRGKIGQALKQDAYHHYFLTALSHDSTHIKSAQQASIYFLKVENFKKAKEIASQALQKVPDTPRLISVLAQIAYKQGNWRESLTYILQLEQLKEGLPVFIYKLKGNNYLKLNEVEASIGAFKTALKLDKQDYEICLKLGELYLIAKQPDQALKYLSLYPRLKDVSMWEYNYQMGQFYMQNKKYQLAFMKFESAHQENVYHEAAQYYRAVAADNFMKDKSKALDYYTNYIQTWQVEKDAQYIELALRRAQDIRQELFMED